MWCQKCTWTLKKIHTNATYSCYFTQDLLLLAFFTLNSMMYESEMSKYRAQHGSIIKSTNSFSRLELFKVSFYPTDLWCFVAHCTLYITAANFKFKTVAAISAKVDSSMLQWNLHICKILRFEVSSTPVIQSSSAINRGSLCSYSICINCNRYFQCSDFVTHRYY